MLPHIRVVAAEIERGGLFLITQRRAEAELPGLWEFPGGRVRDGESDVDALRRSLRERLGVSVQVGHQVLVVSHAYDGYKLDLVVYRCGLTEEPTPRRVADLRWVAPDDFSKYSFPKADQQSVEALLRDA
ncbi:MAG TPA: (deoxy)nucleoside triphosphate pyrophosphohydrolase [Myxococcota bacterium]|nr:(deoxy)nucleoside triphosphate pyrophosphohydrolase [Myxococcota bacterium]HNH45654.1 (deoxy)nucleoside triphosphate pyrophosphohydrolase [Myxococcota bacterium]